MLVGRGDPVGGTRAANPSSPVVMEGSVVPSADAGTLASPVPGALLVAGSY